MTRDPAARFNQTFPYRSYGIRSLLGPLPLRYLHMARALPVLLLQISSDVSELTVRNQGTLAQTFIKAVSSFLYHSPWLTIVSFICVVLLTADFLHPSDQGCSRHECHSASHPLLHVRLLSVNTGSN